MSLKGLRRDKAALSGGYKVPPGGTLQSAGRLGDPFCERL